MFSSLEVSTDDELLQEIRKHLSSGEWRSRVHPKAYMELWFSTLTLLTAQRTSKTTGRLLFRFPVLEEYLTSLRSFAGGAQAAAHDLCTSWAMLTVSAPGLWQSTGLTRSLNVTYLSQAHAGDVLTMDCEILQSGKKLAIVRGTLRREDGTIVSTCEHHKYNHDSSQARL